MLLDFKLSFKPLLKIKTFVMNSYGPTVSKMFYISHRALTDHFSRARNVWIGLNDIRQEGEFYWVDRVLSNSTNTKWQSGEPNNLRNREDCGALNFPRHPLYTINDDWCAKSKPGLCDATIN